MPSVRVLLFGPAKDAMGGVHFIDIDLALLPILVIDIRTAISEQYSKLSFVLMNSIFAVGNAMVPRSLEAQHIIADLHQEIVLVPPVSGG